MKHSTFNSELQGDIFTFLHNDNVRHTEAEVFLRSLGKLVRRRNEIRTPFQNQKHMQKYVNKAIVRRNVISSSANESKISVYIRK